MTDKRNPATEGDFRQLPGLSTPADENAYKTQLDDGTNVWISHSDLKESVKTTDITASGGIKERIQETADGAQKTWTLSYDPDPIDGSNVYVYSNGRLRFEYQISGKNVTFDDAPQAGVIVDITSYAPAAPTNVGTGTITSGANVGAAGVGVFDSVSADLTTLNFRNNASGDGKIVPQLNASAKTIELYAVEANFTLSNIGGQINDSQHGNKPGGSLHAVVDANNNGFMLNTDFTKLANLNVSAQVPAGGTTNQTLVKLGPEDYNTGWADPSTAGVPGHVIYDNNGVALPQAPGLQFRGGSTAGSDAARTIFDISAKADQTALDTHVNDSDIHMSPQQVSDLNASIAHVSASNNPHAVSKAQVGLGNVQDLKVNLTATADPTASNDTNQGYAIGSRWVNATENNEFVCVDASAGAAVWRQTTFAGSSLNLINFGAVGDATTDDGGAYNQFMAAVIAAGTDRTGIIPAGHYKINTATGQYNIPDNLSIYMEPGAIVEWTKDPNTAAFDNTSVFMWLEGSNAKFVGYGEFRNCGICIAANDGTGLLTYNSFTASGDITSLTVTGIVFNRCIAGLFVRNASELAAVYKDVDNVKVEQNRFLDCAWGVCAAAVTSSHNWSVKNNLLYIANGRARSGAGANEPIISAIDISPINLAPYAQEAQTVALSGGHQVVGNNVVQLDWTGVNGPGVDMRIEGIRVTNQNDCLVHENHVGSISAGNFARPGSERLDVRGFYTKIIRSRFTDNKFYGTLQGDIADLAEMLALKGDGYFVTSSTNETREWATVVSGNTFAGTGTRTAKDRVKSALAVYSDLAIIGRNAFQDIHIGDRGGASIFSGVIRFYGNMSNMTVETPTCIRCSTVATGTFGHITVDEGGSSFRLDGLDIIDPDPDNNSANCLGVYFNRINPQENTIRSWVIANVSMKGSPAAPNVVPVFMNDGSGTMTIDGLEIAGIKTDGININHIVHFGGFVPANVTNKGIVVRDCDFDNLTAPINNTSGLPIAGYPRPRFEVLTAVDLTLTAAAHQGNQVTCTAPLTLTVNAATGVQDREDVEIYAKGGTVTIAADGVTIDTANNAPLQIAQHGRAVLTKVGADTYNLIAVSPAVPVVGLSGNLQNGNIVVATSTTEIQDGGIPPAEIALKNTPAEDANAVRTMNIANDLGNKQECFIPLSHVNAQVDVVKNIATAGQLFVYQWTNAAASQATPFINTGGGASFIPSTLPEITEQYQFLGLLCVDDTTDANVFRVLPAALS